MNIPLSVELDRTLVRTGVLIESVVALLQKKVRCVLALPFWLLRGKAGFKQEIAQRIALDVSRIPYQSDFRQFLQSPRARHSLVLATGRDEQLAQRIANQLEIFDSVLASDGSTHLSGERRRERLSQFGEKGSDYAADGGRDVAVWSSARKAVVVSPNQQPVQAIARVAQVQSVIEDRSPGLADYLNAFRPRHWLKNLLVFVPFFGLSRLYEPALLGRSVIVFIAFCCCASSGYLVNDLVDLSSDRNHPTKRLRPFAAGQLPLSYAVTMIPILIVLGCVLGLLVARLVVAILLLYCALALSYSLYAKRVVLLDVIILAGFYALRIAAGAAAVGLWLSGWVFAFSTLLFVSLALAKRYVELVVLQGIDGDHARARSYESRDAELLASMGVSSGYTAVVVLFLCVTSRATNALYGRHKLMWLLCPLLLYWVSYIWLVAHRGTMHDDPFVFALRDRTSRILILLMMATAFLAV
jgi:4-hydroxybenzoate polyprenyltransferase